MRIRLGRTPVQRWRLDLESLPVVATQSGSRFLAIAIIVFAMVWGGFPVFGLVSVLQAGRAGPETALFLVFPLAGVGLVLYGIHRLLWRRSVAFDGSAFTVAERGLFGLRKWTEPLSAYQGVMRRTRHVRTRNRNYTLYMVDLLHRDEDRSINLYTDTTERGFRNAWEDYARRLHLPAFEEGEGGVVRREAGDLDKSVGELIREGKVEIDYETLSHRAKGLAVDFQGDTVVVTRTGPANPWWGSLLAVIFPLVFVAVALFVPDLPMFGRLLFCGMGALFELVFAIGVLRDLTSRQRLRIGPDGVAVSRVSSSGETARQEISAADVESVSIAQGSDGWRHEVVLAGDSSTLRFGKGLPRTSVDFVLNAILAKFAETEPRHR